MLRANFLLPDDHPDRGHFWFIEGNLTSLPPLPPHARAVYVQGNPLEELPDSLPAGITMLSVIDGDLRRLPERLPNSLVHLDVSNNYIEQLPLRLPDSLAVLNVDFNLLRDLGRNLPAQLQQLSAASNQLRELPEQLPAGLTTVDLTSNQIRNLPGAYLQRVIDGQIEVGRNPVTADGNLPAAYAAAHAVAQWLDQPQAATAAARALVQALSAEPEDHKERAPIKAFSTFLGRLTATKEALNPETQSYFRAQVSEWLLHLGEHPELLRISMAISLEANSRCEDRVAVHYQAMTVARLGHDVATGDFNGRLPELMPRLRVQFRLSQIERLARQHAQAMESARPQTSNDAVEAAELEEVEVHLALQVMLNEPLQLGLPMHTMAWFGSAELSEDQITEICNQVRQAEQTQFASFLVNDCATWTNYLQQNAIGLHNAHQDSRIERLGEFEGALNERVRLLELPEEAIDDARRILGPAVLAGVQLSQANADLLAQLRAMGHPELIHSPWEPGADPS